MDNEVIPRVGVTIAPTKQVPFEAVVELAILAENLGYESFWVPETWGWDAVSLLTVLGTKTDRILLASGVLNVFSRSATLIAQTAASLQSISGGRFILGLGTSGPLVVEHWHGVPFRQPIERTRTYVNIIRTALGGGTVDFTDHGMELSGFRLLNPPDREIPIYIAALGPRNVRLAGEIASGWLPIFAARGQLGPLFALLEEGANAARRSAANIDVAAYLPAAVTSGGELLLRQQLAYYIGGMGTFYADFVTRLGYRERADELQRLWKSGDRRAAVRAVSDELLEVCTLGVEEESARMRVAAYRDDGIALPIVAPAHGAIPQQIADTLEALAPGL